MEYLSECPLCKSIKILRYGKKSLTKRYKPENPIDAEDQFLLERLKRMSLVRSIYLCRSCYFLFQNPTYDKEDLQNLYNDRGPRTIDYYEIVGKSAKDLWSSSLAQKNLGERQNRYANAITTLGGGKILDYGGGSGINLMHASLKHMKRYVYDFGRDRITQGGIISIKNLDVKHRFDFILHTHVLEHEPDPQASLKKLRQLIAPEGFLYLEVPFEYAERILTRRPGAIWHVNYFNRRTIMEIAERTGWLCQVIKISNLPYDHIFMNCIVAIMRPNLKGLHHNRPVRNVQVGYDMVRSLLARMVYPLFRK